MEESYFGGDHTSLGWQNSDKSAAAAAAVAALQANCAAAEQLQPFLTLNWNQHQQSDQGTAPGVTHFHQSHLTSAAPPSPAPHHLLSQAAASLANDSAAFRELIERLNPGGGEISQWANFTSAACFNPPHSFAPTLPIPTHPTLPTTAAATQLSSLAVDPGFVERAARFSSFCGGLPGQFPLPELPTVPPISPTMRPGPGGGGSQLGVADNNAISVMSRSSTPEDAEFRGVRDDSPSGSDHKFSHSNSKKRKPDAPPPLSRIPLKAVAEEDASAKRMKPTETLANGKEELSPKLEGNAGANSSGGGGGGDGSRKQGKENNSNSKAAEPPKDYIHVRARRGQATDSHSLAERVRREKISQRMKFLQDLVPGCNKVTGKAVMLDEIINYVQSLQRQVEFLSMKLATVNPQMDFNSTSLLQKDMYQPRGSLPNTVFQMESSSSLPFPFAQPPPPGASQDGHHLQHNNNVGSSGGIESHLLNPMDSTLKRPLNGGVQIPAALDGFGGASSRVGGSFMEDDLQSVVQMGLGQGQEDSFSSRPFQGPSPPHPDMKIKF